MPLNENEEYEYLKLKQKSSKPASFGQNILSKIPQLSGAETAGNVVGQLGGDFVGGPAGGVIGGGMGAAGADALPYIGRQVKNYATLQPLQLPNFNRIPELMQTAKKGAELATMGEAVPAVWKGAKALGRTAEEGMGALSGMTERLGQMKKLPFREQLSVMNPFSKLPKPEIAGAAQGAVEKRLGIPTVKEATLERIYADPKKLTRATQGGAQTSVEAEDILTSKNISPKAKASLQKQLDSYKSLTGESHLPSPKSGESTPIMRSVRTSFQNKVEPKLSDAVQSLRDTAVRLGKAQRETVEHAAYSEEYGKLNNYIGSKIKELGEARHLTHLANLHDELVAILPKMKSGDPYRMGILRLLYMASGAAAGLMSPFAAGASSVAGQALGKVVDPILANRATPAILNALMQKRSNLTPTQTSSGQ